MSVAFKPRRAGARRPEAVVSPFPLGFVTPCFAVNRGQPPRGPRWVHEIKYDGFRAQAHIRGGQVRIYSSRQNDWTYQYRSVAEEMASLPVREAVLDGEMVVLRPDGTCDYWALHQDTLRGDSQRLSYFVFDILFHDGEDVRPLPLSERKARLRTLLGNQPATARLQPVDYLEGEGADIWTKAHAFNVEGIVSKPVESAYRSGADDWIKTPCAYRETLVVAGMAFDGEGFDGLYLARRHDDGLRYAGKLKAKFGIKPEQVEELRLRLEPLIVKNQTVATHSAKKGARWVEPVLEARIVHRGGNGVERIRRPVLETIVGSPPKKARLRPVAAPMPENIQRRLDDAEVPTRAQLRAHWSEVGKQALEHVGNRPLTLVRHAGGLTFFHQGPLPPTAASVHKLEIRKADGKKGIRLWVDSVAGLLDLVDIGVVELHPWAATVADIERPDTMIFDLDPGPGIEWPFVRDTALALRTLLSSEGFECWPKLTGGSGLHLMAPIEPGLTHKQVHDYSIEVARRIADRAPDKYTLEPGASRRVGKLFIDHLRNGRGFTAVGAYSPRARKGLPIAMPTTWDEIAGGKPPAVCLRSG